MTIGRRSKTIAVITAISFLLAMLTSCSKGNGAEEAAPVPAVEAFDTSKPVKLKLYMGLLQPDEWIQRHIIVPVQKKYPNISIEIVRRGKGSNPDELVVAGNFPDLIYESIPRYAVYKDLGLLYDMNDFIKKYKFDTSKLNPLVVDALKVWGENGELYHMPLWMNFSVLYYNKDIFDKFGVAYPKDGMTWDEAIELSKALTKTQDGITYHGIDPNSITGMAHQLSLNFVDQKTHRALLEDDGFKRIFQTFLSAYKIPGNENRSKVSRDAFLKDRKLAMYPFYADMVTLLADTAAKGTPLNWDMVSLPSFPERPGMGYEVDSHNLSIASSSANKEAAFLVVSYLTSHEPQLELSKAGYLPVSTDPELLKSFGTNQPELKGKHVDAIFKTKPSPFHKFTLYDSLATGKLSPALTEAEKGGKDINTVLREASEAANKAIDEKKLGSSSK
jgi:multiple sugar transport system substrate-binding protein